LFDVFENLYKFSCMFKLFIILDAMVHDDDEQDDNDVKVMMKMKIIDDVKDDDENDDDENDDDGDDDNDDDENDDDDNDDDQ